MTLKPIETEFSERLLKQNKIDESQFDLSLKAPLITILPPKIIWAQLQFERNPEQEVAKVEIPGWHYQCFSDFQTAEKNFSAIQNKFQGTPANMFQFLKSQASEALIDFAPLGAALISKSPLTIEVKNELHERTLPLWLHYALSPELWGEQGKWTRFHSRLHNLLKGKGLLSEEDFPGHYPLQKSAKKLESFGFHGSDLEKAYLLVLPWSFSLTALEKLEKCIQQEF